VPIYGTGWYYPPYWGVCCYYPRPVTYGVHVTYNPYTGWGMGFSYSFGFITVGIAFGGGYGGYYRPGYPPPIYYRPPAYYPPGGYRPPGYPPNHRPGAPRPTPYQGGGTRPSAGQLPAGGGGRPSAGQLPASNNLYANAANRDRVTPSSVQRSNLQSIDRTARGANNVYGDAAGNVHRQTSQGWESRSQNQWQSSSSRPSQAPSNLNRDYGARQTGASRSMAMPRGGGGGGRRR
jgi:hypothetical protein